MQDETLNTLKEIADALNGEAGIVDTLTQQIANAKTEAVQTAKEDATSKANAAQAAAAKTAKDEATQYTNSKLEGYYTKAEVDESQQKQDARIKALEDARPTSGAGALYDFAQAAAVKTGETIKLADGTVKDIYRLCVERELASQSLKGFSVPLPATAQNILKIDGYSFIANEIVPIAEAFNFSMEDGKIYLVQKDTTKQFLSSRVIINCF